MKIAKQKTTEGRAWGLSFYKQMFYDYLCIAKKKNEDLLCTNSATVQQKKIQGLCLPKTQQNMISPAAFSGTLQTPAPPLLRHDGNLFSEPGILMGSSPTTKAQNSSPMSAQNPATVKKVYVCSKYCNWTKKCQIYICSGFVQDRGPCVFGKYKVVARGGAHWFLLTVPDFCEPVKFLVSCWEIQKCLHTAPNSCCTRDVALETEP